MNFLQFVENKNNNNINKQILNESFKNSQLDKVRELIIDILVKNTGKIIKYSGNIDLNISSEDYTSELYIYYGGKNNIQCFTLNWLNSGKSSEIYSISFFKDLSILFSNSGNGKSDLTIETLGSSIVYFIPIISHILQSKDYNLNNAEALKYSKTVFKESKVWYSGALKYVIYENLSNKIVKDTFTYNLGIFNENSAIDYKKDKYEEVKRAHYHRNDSPEAKQKSKDLWKEYEIIKNAIRGGATTIDEVKLAVKNNLTVRYELPQSDKTVETEIKKQKENPEVAFKKMEIYLKAVTTGQQPGTIICGAPGIGKTYRVNKYLKEQGYTNYDDLVDPEDTETPDIVFGNEDKVFITVKGTCRLRQLYTTLYNFRGKNNIIIVDDADSIVGPKAPEDAINILKAALDSSGGSKGRLVTYMITGDIVQDGQIIPKRMFFNGGMIVLTNHGVGDLHKALKGRVFTQTLDFDNEQILQLIKGLISKLGNGMLSDKSKDKAYNYLMKLAKNQTKMQISIRSFTAAARLYELTDGESLNEEQVEEMIKEQMENQAMTGGKSFL